MLCDSDGHGMNVRMVWMRREGRDAWATEGGCVGVVMRAACMLEELCGECGVVCGDGVYGVCEDVGYEEGV